MSHKTRFALFAALACTSGCVNQMEVHPEEEAGHEAVFFGEDEALLEQLSVDEDGFSLTPVLRADDSELVSRVAFRFDAASAFSVQVRSSMDGAAFTAWQDAEVTYQEDTAHNAHLDVATGTTHAQLRFLAPVEAGLKFLAVEMFSYQPQAEEPGAIDTAVNEAEQGLAADGIVTRANGAPACATAARRIHRTV